MPYDQQTIKDYSPPMLLGFFTLYPHTHVQHFMLIRVKAIGHSKYMENRGFHTNSTIGHQAHLTSTPESVQQSFPQLEVKGMEYEERKD